MGLSGLRGAAFPPPSIGSMSARDNDRSVTGPLPSPHPRLRIDMQMLVESTDDGQTNRHQRTMGSEAYPTRRGRPPRSYANIPSLPRCDSPVSYAMCDGWCNYDSFESRFAVSVLSFSFCLNSPFARISCRYQRARTRNALGKPLTGR